MTGGQIPTMLWRHWTLAAGPDLAAVCAAVAYLLGVRRVRRGWPWRRTASFLAGLACVLVAIQSGIDAEDDRLLSDHMVQHLLLLELAPLLLLVGRPMTLALRAATPAQRPGLARRFRALRAAATPLLCLLVIWVVVGATHLPAFYDATLRHPLLHDLEHALYVTAGLFMWWPLLDEQPVLSHRLGGLGRLIYMSLAMAPMTLLGAYLNRDPTLFYTPYAGPARALGISAVTDQQQAGALMWVVGSSLIVVCGLWQVMAAMIDEERRMQSRERREDEARAQEALPW